jgi:hypothetical protein
LPPKKYKNNISIISLSKDILFFIELYILSKNNIFEIVIDKIRDLSVFSAKLSRAKFFGLI